MGEPPGCSCCSQEVSPAADHLCPLLSWTSSSWLGSCWSNWSHWRQEVPWPLQEGGRAQLCPCPCLPPCWRIWLQQVRSWLLLHRQEPPGCSWCPQEVSPAFDHLCPLPSWTSGSWLGSCWTNWSHWRQEVPWPIQEGG